MAVPLLSGPNEPVDGLVYRNPLMKAP